MGKIADFYAELKIKDTLSMTLKTALQAMGDLRLSTIGEITALGVLGDMLKNAGSKAMDMSAGYTTLNKELGISTDLLQRWQNVARSKTTVSPEAVAGGFAHIQQVLAAIKAGGDVDTGFMKGAALLGMRINAGTTYQQVLEELRTRVPEAINNPKVGGVAGVNKLLGDMGLDKMQQLFMLNQKQFTAGQYSSPILSQNEIKDWTALNEQIHVLSFNLMMLSEKALKPMIPAMIKLANILLTLEGKGGKTIAAVENRPPGWNPAKWEGVLLKHGFVLGKMLEHRISTHQQITNYINIHGGETHAIAAQVKHAIKSAIQEIMTTAAQSQNSQAAY